MEPRYLGWLAQSDLVVEEIVSRSVGVSYPAINASEIGFIPVPFPTLEQQRAIADYLDAETARIDALIEKKAHLIDLVTTRRDSELVDLLLGEMPQLDLPPGWKWMKARHVCPQITVGVVVEPSSYFTDEGVPFIHGTDVRRGWIDETDLKFMSRENNASLAKSQVHGGDVVAMRVGEPGRAAVVPRHLDGSNCASILIFRRSHLARKIEERETKTRWGRVVIERQVDLLREHRQALITSAVTGDLEIPGIAA
jgi:type I restriction enzyme, S subunit